MERENRRWSWSESRGFMSMFVATGFQWDFRQFEVDSAGRFWL